MARTTKNDRVTRIRIRTLPVFDPLLKPARYKAAYGGRGSGKSHFFAELMVEDALRFPGDAGEGMRGICGREVQKDLKDSAKFLIESKLLKFGLGESDGFKVFRDRIATPKDGLIIFQGIAEHTAESIKSLENFHRFWGEEAQAISRRSLGLIRPTIRWEDNKRGLQSELWFSWNPTKESDAVDELFRSDERPTGAIVVKANWSDNKWFPKILEQERQDCLRLAPDQYDHIWEGGYATVLEGAYYARHLADARSQGRIGVVAPDPLMSIRAFWDIGGTGTKADATAIVICQFVGLQIRVLDYYEAVGQPLDVHLAWLRSRGYDGAEVYLPHDGRNHEKIYKVTYEGAIREAGFSVRTVPNQGPGAYLLRVEAGRRLFPSIWFNEATTKPLISALGWYHEKRDDNRRIGLGEHVDWSNHGADAFGLMCVSHEEPRRQEAHVTPFFGPLGWMA